MYKNKDSKQRICMTSVHSICSQVVKFIKFIPKFNPHNTDILYHLIISCGQTKIHYLHLSKLNRLFVFTLHIILHIIYLTYHMNENQKSATPAPFSNFAVIYAKNKMAVFSHGPNEQDMQYPITS